jgi:hypothetical protein
MSHREVRLLSIARRTVAVLVLALAVAVVLSAVGAVEGCRKAAPGPSDAGVPAAGNEASVSSGSDAGATPSGNEASVSSGSDAGATPSGNEAPITLYARMKVALYQANVPEELVDVGEVDAGQEVKVISVEGAWTQVQADSIEGWLPSWYLTVTASQDDSLAEIEPYFMFLKDPVDLCLTPEATDEAPWQLGPGGIVVVKALWGDWAYVYIRVYSIPAASRGWVKVSALGTRSEVQPVEADLLAGTRVYYNNFLAPPDDSATSETTTYDMWVGFGIEVGPWTQVWTGGGWVAWVKTTDLHYPETGPGQ